MINHYKGYVAVSENDAETIRENNKARHTEEKRRKWQVRRAIERREEDLALERELNYLH